MSDESNAKSPESEARRGLNRPVSRREFVGLLTAVGAVAGGGLLSRSLRNQWLTPAQSAELQHVGVDQMGKLPQRPLGTRMGGMHVSPIVMSQDWNSDLFAPALAVGINFIHKAGYWKEMPDEFQGIPRESYYTDITVDSTPNHPDDEDGAYNQVTSSLARNGLKYYDIYRAHYGWKSVDIMNTQRGTYRAFLRLKKEGKVKYFGVSQHPYVPYSDITAAQIDEGLIDSMQVWCSYDSTDEERQIFEMAHKAGIGMTAMKVHARGAQGMSADKQRQAELKASGLVGRALIRHVLTTPGSNGKPFMDCCVSAIGSYEMFEENVGAFAPGVMASDGFVHDHKRVA